jgi:pilus assembly protein CpaE
VLPAPGEFSPLQVSDEAIDKLLSVARQCFDYVVVDAGARIDLRGTALFEESAVLYLVAQVGVTELRNSNRLISQFLSNRGRKLQIVLNRYTPHTLLFDDQQIDKALTRPAQWKIPDDYATARRTRNTATPVALEDSPISRAIRQMARTACGLPANPEKKKGFSLFSRKFWSSSKPSLKIAES